MMSFLPQEKFRAVILSPTTLIQVNANCDFLLFLSTYRGGYPMRALSQLILGVTIAVLLTTVVTTSASNAARRAQTRSSYDGTWSVVIYTLRGDCGSVRAALRIVGGRVYSGDSSYQANGAVGGGGAVRVTLVRGGQWAFGSGRLSNSSGSGRWRTSGGECLGTWSATRYASYY